MRGFHALQTNKNPAQSGITVSVNRLNFNTLIAYFVKNILKRLNSKALFVFRTKNRTNRAVSVPRTAVKTQLSNEAKHLAISSGSLGCVIVGHFGLPLLTGGGVVGLVYLVLPIWKRAYHDITRRKRFTRMVMESMVLPGTLLTGHFVAAASAYWFLYFALHIVAKAKGRATENLAEMFIAPAHQVVYIMRDGVEIELTLETVQAGDILVVGAGENIPVDGTIVEGQATIDQRLLARKAQYVEKQVGDKVFAATMLLRGRILVSVEQTGQATLASQTQQMLQGMVAFTNTLELRSTDMADRLALPYVAIGAAATVLRGTSSGLAISWSPLDDALYAAGPLSVLNHLNCALQRGILVKDGRSLEVLRQVDTVVFDKTGTLTQAVPQVVHIHTCGIQSEQAILRYAGAAENKQTHPVAQAILAETTARQIELPEAQETSYSVGYGLQVTLEEQRVHVGSLRYMEQQGFVLPETLHQTQQAAHEIGDTLIYIAVEGTIVGAIALRAALRPDTVEAMQQLQALGYRLCFISGDHKQPTRHLAQRLGIDEYFAEQLPEHKADLLQEMQSNGHAVCYVGDGTHDTTALKQAEVSVSLRGASTMATNAAQVVLMHGDLRQLVELIQLSRALDSSLKRTFWVSAVPSVAIITGVFMLHIGLSAAIVGYAAGMGMSVMNAALPISSKLLNDDRLET